MHLKAPGVMDVHSGCYEIEYLNSQILELVSHLRRSARDIESCRDLCTSSAGDLVPYSNTSGSHIDHIGLCYSHNICYSIIWPILCKSFYIYTYGDTGITEMVSATGCIYLKDIRVDRHHLII